MNDVSDVVDKGTRALESAGNISQGFGRIALMVTVLAVIGAAGFAYYKLSNVAGVVIDAGAAVVDAGVDGTKAAIEGAGSTVGELTEAVGTAVDNSGIDPSAVVQGADEAVTGGLTWLEKRRDQLGAALDGNDDTSVNGTD